MSQPVRSNSADVRSLWIEADNLRVRWEQAEAELLRCAKRLIACKNALPVEEVHILDRFAVERAQEALSRAKENARTAYGQWHAALDGFLSNFDPAAYAKDIGNVVRVTSARKPRSCAHHAGHLKALG